MHVRRLEVEIRPRIGQNAGFVIVQEHQSTKVWTGVHVCESGLSTDAHHLQRFGYLCFDAVQEGLAIDDGLPALGVILGGIGSKDMPGCVEGHYDSGALMVTATVESISGEALDAGLVEEMESAVSKEREQLLLLFLRQAGRDGRHGGQIAVQSQIQTPDWLVTPFHIVTCGYDQGCYVWWWLMLVVVAS